MMSPIAETGYSLVRPQELRVISRDDIALVIVRFLEHKILVDPAATTTYDELAIVLIAPLSKCAGEIAEAAALVDVACFTAGLPLLGTFRVRRSDGSIDVTALPAPAWRERCIELQRRDELHRWDSADFSAVRYELQRLAGCRARLAWDKALKANDGAALARALRAGRPSAPEHALLPIGIEAARKPPAWRPWRF